MTNNPHGHRVNAGTCSNTRRRCNSSLHDHRPCWLRGTVVLDGILASRIKLINRISFGVRVRVECLGNGEVAALWVAGHEAAGKRVVISGAEGVEAAIGIELLSAIAVSV